jgi:polar amino acid transport system substrate-binding protein
VVAQPTAAGVRVDADQRFLSYVNNWLEYNRSLTTVRGWIIDNLALVGIQPDDIPPTVQF